MIDNRYADCDVCGERYHGGDIERYMKEVEPERDRFVWVCYHHKESEVNDA